MTTLLKTDPYVAHKFLVEIDHAAVASFAEVSGLQFDIEFEEYQEGGENRFRHKLPKSARYANLTLRRGLTHDALLWDWFQARMRGEVNTPTASRRSITIVLWGVIPPDETWRWEFKDAYPVKWVGPDLKAETGAVAFESLDFAHSGLSSGGPVGGRHEPPRP